MKTEKRIAELLQDFDLVNPELAKIIQSLRKMILSIASESKEKVMYGGIIFTIPERMFCGLFLRKNHVSVEFDLGYLLKDIENHLEGSGKYRRHLKIHSEYEVKIKQVEGFIKECFNLSA